MNQNLSKSAKLRTQYIEIRQALVNLCKPLEIEDYIPQPVEFVSPPKWNLAHTSWFFEEFILKLFKSNYKVYNEKYLFLFNSYYQGAGNRISRFSRGVLSRPTVKEVYQYREYIDTQMLELMKNEVSDEIKDLIILGLNHDQQHQELFLSDLKYTFSLNPLLPKYSNTALCETGSAGDSDFIHIPEGLYGIGFKGTGFCYDNEKENHRVFLQEYKIASTLVSNKEYLEFIRDGGYKNSDLWHDEGWLWVNTNKITSPLYWEKQKDEWFQYTLAGLRKLAAKHPVTHISYYEAFAFAQWKNCRLPTEYEWEAAADKIFWGDRWEWTESAYLPYPGYKKAIGAVGEYNGKFMVNQKVLRGSSPATPIGHSRKTYRNFFHPGLSWQFNGIRLAK